MHVEMEGSFSFLDSRAFHHLLSVLRDNQHIGEVRFYLKSLKSIDSTALSLIMEAFDAAKKAHCDFLLVGAHGQVQQALASAAVYNCFRVAV
jgi:anti-anti-sigma factor